MKIRPIDPMPDSAALATLMFEAYRGTIDDTGESLDETRVEIGRFFDGSYGAFQAEASVGFVDEDESLQCVCLVNDWKGHPLISLIATLPEWKNQGLAGALLQSSLARLHQGGHAVVRAIITDGNIPSEKLFLKEGFVWKERRAG